jgi:hypothetical protein
MAHFNAFDSDLKATATEKLSVRAFDGKQIAAVTAGLLLLTTFAVIGCSKSKQTPGNSSNTIGSALSGPAPAAASTLPVMPATTEKVAPKKMSKKRSTTVTYKDVASGVSFQYPRKYALKTGNEAKLDWNGLGPVSMNFVEPGGVTIAAVELPRGSYPGTDFASAFFNVSMHRSLSADACSKFGLTDAVHPDEPAAPTKVQVGGKEFDQVEDFGGEAIKQADAKYYHLYENGACYEFALGLGTAGYGTEEGIEPVDRAEVFSRLEKILATVKLQPVAEKDVVISKANESPSTEVVGEKPVGTSGGMEKGTESTTKQAAVQKTEPDKNIASGTTESTQK